MDTGTAVIEPAIDGGSMSDDQVLAYGQNVRINVVRHLTSNKPGGLPGDKEERDALFKALDGLDKVALTRKRIAADQDTANGMSHAVSLVAHILRQSKSSYNTIDASEIESTRPTPTLGHDVPPPVLVPGETEIHAPQLDYDSFVSNRDE